MRILFSSLEHNGYDPKRGKSFEYNNFYRQLCALGHEVIFLPFDLIPEKGRDAFNKLLLEAVEKNKPDLFWAFMYTDEFDPAILDEIKKLTPSLAWFSDDHWRLENYSRYYAQHFTWIVTTWSKAAEEYAKFGIKNVIRSQWGCNVADYYPMNIPRDVDVSFVGMRTPNREAVINKILNAGIKIEVIGAGWPAGEISFPELIRLFSRSRINLNLNPPMSSFSIKPLAQIFIRRSSYRGVPNFLQWPVNFRERAVFNPDLFASIRSFKNKAIPQIKARPFEIAGCGGFCISGLADDIESYYAPDKEMVFYANTDDLIAKIRYYLKNEDVRNEISERGYAKTIAEHSYKCRFEKIFKEINLKS